MFLKNYWYVAAWSNEIERQPLGRILLNEPVVFFRKQDGAVAALKIAAHIAVFLCTRAVSSVIRLNVAITA